MEVSKLRVLLLHNCKSSSASLSENGAKTLHTIASLLVLAEEYLGS